MHTVRTFSFPDLWRQSWFTAKQQMGLLNPGVLTRSIKSLHKTLDSTRAIGFSGTIGKNRAGGLTPDIACELAWATTRIKQ